MYECAKAAKFIGWKWPAMPRSLVAAFVCLLNLHASDMPRFEDYPVHDPFHGPPAEPRLVEAGHRYYRTRIREGAARGPNFAGHYAAVSFGCGSNCGLMFLVDLKTGKIHKPPRAVSGWILPNATTLGPEVDFRKDSSLFRLKDCEDVQKRSCFHYSFRWQRNQWTLIHKLPLAQ